MSKPNIAPNIAKTIKSGLHVRNIYIVKTCLEVFCGDKIDATITPSKRDATHDVPVLGEGWSELFSLTMNTVQTPFNRKRSLY